MFRPEEFPLPLLLEDPNKHRSWGRWYKRGKQALRAGNHREAFDFFLIAVSQENDPKADYMLVGTPEVNGAAIEFMAERGAIDFWDELVQRADSGEIGPCYLVGYMLYCVDELGVGYVRDKVRAQAYLQRAADAGHCYAKLRLAMLYPHLPGSPQHLYEAAYNDTRWIDEALSYIATVGLCETEFVRRLMWAQSADYSYSALMLEYVFDAHPWQDLVPWGKHWSTNLYCLQDQSVRDAIWAWLLVGRRIGLLREMQLMIVGWICTKNNW